MSMKIPLTPSGIEPATFRFVTQLLYHCATDTWFNLNSPCIVSDMWFNFNIRALFIMNSIHQITQLVDIYVSFGIACCIDCQSEQKILKEGVRNFSRNISVSGST